MLKEKRLRAKFWILLAICAVLVIMGAHPALAASGRSTPGWWPPRWYHFGRGTDGPFDAPEIDLTALSGAVAVCVGAVLLLVERFRRRR